LSKINNKKKKMQTKNGNRMIGMQKGINSNLNSRITNIIDSYSQIDPFLKQIQGQFRSPVDFCL